MEAQVSAASSALVRSCVRSNLGYELLGEAHRLLMEDDVEGLKSILAKEGRAKRGVMLVFACVHGASRCAQYLVKQGAMQDVDMTACGRLRYCTPITVAALLCHWEVVDALVEGGAEAHAFDRVGFSALFIAAHHHPEGNLESLLRLEDIRRHMNTANPYDFTPLMAASASAVPLLVEAGAEVTQANQKRGTALLQACAESCFEKVKALTECGADENQAVSRGWTPLLWAAKKGQVDIVEYLLARSGINIDARPAETVLTALDLACQEGHLEVVKLLAGAGARVEGQESDELGALVAAIVGGHLQVVKYLVEEAGADERRADAGGWTPLLWAANEGQVDIVEYLLVRSGISIDAKTAEGLTALDIACREGHLEVVKLLVGAGAKLNAQDSDEFGPLREAALGGHLHVVKYVVEDAGAGGSRGEPGLKDGLLHAIQMGHTDIVEYLRQIVSRREKEALRVAEERAAAAAAALLEEEERAAAAKEASSKKKKKKGKKKGGAAAPSYTLATSAPEQGPTSTVEASETTDETQVMTAVLSALDLGDEATVTATGRDGQQERDESSMASVGPTVPRISPAEDLQDRSQGPATSSDEIPEAAVAHVAPPEDEQDEACSIVVTSDELSCPISLQLMTDPVMADDGHTYQQAAIEEWISKCIAAGRPLTSPLTGAEMGSTLRPNLLFRSLVRRRGGR